MIADLLQLPMNLAIFAGAMTVIGLITADVPLEGLDIDRYCDCVRNELADRFSLDAASDIRPGNGPRHGCRTDLDRMRCFCSVAPQETAVAAAAMTPPHPSSFISNAAKSTRVFLPALHAVLQSGATISDFDSEKLAEADGPP